MAEQPTGRHNPKERKRKPKNKTLGNVVSPVKDEIKREEDAGRLYGGYRYVPLFEGGDACIKFFEKMRKLSPTHGAVINSMKDYSFSGDFTVINKSRQGFASHSEEVTEDITKEQWDNYLEFILEVTPEDKLKELVESCFDNKKSYGNHWIEVVLTSVSGEKFGFIHGHDADTCRYLYTEKGAPRIVLVSPLWDQDYISKNPPDLVPLYPNYSAPDETGTIRTMIHVKNNTIGRDWYGEPDSSNSLYFQYLDYQLGCYTTEGYGNQWIGEVFFETSGDAEDENDDYTFDDAIHDTFTQSGSNRKRVIHRNKDTKDEATKVYEFKRPTKEGFHKAMESIAEKQVIKSHKWHSVLMMSTPGALSQRSEFDEIFINKYRTVIKKEQDGVMNPVNLAFSIVATWKEFETNNMCLTVENVFADKMNKQDSKLLNGAQVNAIKELALSVSTGLLDRGAAIAILMGAFGFNEIQADKMIVDKIVEVKQEDLV